MIMDKQISDVANLEEVITVVDEVFHDPNMSMVPKVYLDCEKGDFRAMPARVGNVAGVKWVSVHPGNTKVGKPTVQAVIILNDAETGELLGMMDGTYITKLRTAAAAGVATRLLANKDAQVAAFIGCGGQTQLHVEAVLHALPNLKKLRFFDLDVKRSREVAGHFEHKEIVYAPSVQDCVKDADVVTTLTPSTQPVVEGHWLMPGVHINAMGADAAGKREFDRNTYKRVDIWVYDEEEQAFHSGETQHRATVSVTGCLMCSLSECLGRSTKDQITLFDSTGVAIQDIAVANYILQKVNKGD